MGIDPKSYPKHLIEVEKEEWRFLAESHMQNNLIQVWLSKYYLVQVFGEKDEVTRLTISRTQKNGLRWKDEITWDTLMEIKRQVGMGKMYSIEIFPRDIDIVNVANMRHLWVLPKPLNIGWFK